ncbi:hypothetical protein OAH18_02280 [bacterium]|nr:hypothetical protein [bacterium]
MLRIFQASGAWDFGIWVYVLFGLSRRKSPEHNQPLAPGGFALHHCVFDISTSGKHWANSFWRLLAESTGTLSQLVTV